MVLADAIPSHGGSGLASPEGIRHPGLFLGRCFLQDLWSGSEQPDPGNSQPGRYQVPSCRPLLMGKE